MRKSFNTLSALVVELGREVLSGHFFLFVSRDRKWAKVLFFDGTGLCLLAKRLEKGRFAAVYLGPIEAPFRRRASDLAYAASNGCRCAAITRSPGLRSELSGSSRSCRPVPLGSLRQPCI